MKNRFAIFLTALFAATTALAADWSFVAGTPATITDGDWTFEVTPFYFSTEQYNLVVGTCTQAPAVLSVLDFSKPVVNADAPEVSYPIIELNPRFTNRWGETVSVGREAVGSLILPETGLTRISAAAFMNCSNLVSVTPFLPASVVRIDNSAFYKTAVTNDLTLTGVSAVNYETFTGIRSKSVTFGDNLVELGHSSNGYEGPFEGCANLESVFLGDSLCQINTRVFRDCTNLTTVEPYLPTAVTNIADQAFWNTNIGGAIDLAGVVAITGRNTFGNTAIESVKFGRNLKTIGQASTWNAGAFANCTALSEFIVSVNASDVFLGEATFYNCAALTGTLDLRCVSATSRYLFSGSGITGVIFGSGLKELAGQTFAHADNITDVWYHGGMPTIGEKVFDSLIPLTVTNHVNANGVPSWTAVSDSGSLGIGSTWTSSTQQYIVGFTPEETVTLISIR